MNTYYVAETSAVFIPYHYGKTRFTTRIVSTYYAINRTTVLEVSRFDNQCYQINSSKNVRFSV